MRIRAALNACTESPVGGVPFGGHGEGHGWGTAGTVSACVVRGLKDALRDCPSSRAYGAATSAASPVPKVLSHAFPMSPHLPAGEVVLTPRSGAPSHIRGLVAPLPAFCLFQCALLTSHRPRLCPMVRWGPKAPPYTPLHLRGCAVPSHSVV